MKKFWLVMFLVLSVLWCTSISFAAESGENLGYIHEEIFKRILFDYNFLTDNTESESREIFNDLDVELEEQKIAFLQSIGITQETSEEIVLFIQDNYDELIENKTTEVKDLIDKYLLTHSLKYYYNILGDDYEYQEAVVPTIENCGNQTRSSTANVVSLRVCSDPSTWGTNSAETGLAAAAGHHAWIQVQNLTNSEITVGGLPVGALKCVTIGTWHGSVHDGIFYNYEVYKQSEYSSFSTTESVYAVQLLNQSELNVLNTQIVLPANDDWWATNNCSSFAEKMWNSVADYPVNAGIIDTPKALAESILEEAGGSTQLMLPNAEIAYYGGANPVEYKTID
ncbi:MAG: hypothetical protein IKJ32_06580 [Clostridia bacterium]|nr:hypothetical protein [Clostridia bacterium]